MCIRPNTLADGTQVACHECWQCVERAINDWVGRNIAESKTAKASYAVTLTYGRNRVNDVDHERAVLLTYSDIQKYLKLLRRHGFPVRYFVTGEFGSKKGRAHWHIMLYFEQEVPEHVLGQNFMQMFWPHGYSFWTEPNAHAIRYNCKYVQKTMGDDLRQGHLAMSKKPPLGAKYFELLAERYVKQGLAPQTLEYKFPEVTRRKKDGTFEIVPFMLKDRSAELFLQHFIDTWALLRPLHQYPKSQLLEEFLDPSKRKERLIRDKWRGVTDFTPAQRIQIDKDLAALAKIEKERKPWVEVSPMRKAYIADTEQWWAVYISEAEDGTEERHKRQFEFAEFELRRDEQLTEELYQQQVAKGEFYEWHEEYEAKRRARSGAHGLDADTQVGQFDQFAAQLQRGERWGSDQHLGPIGGWNRRYGKASR